MLTSYLVRRVLIFIPTLFAISLIAFVLSINAPGDPIENRFRDQTSGKAGESQSQVLESSKDSLRHKLGLDLPVFYFSLTTAAEPDTLYRIGDKAERENLSRLLDRFGNWTEIAQWYSSLVQLKAEAALKVTPDSVMLASVSADSIRYCSDHFYQIVLSLLRSNDPVEIDSKLSFLEQESKRFGGSSTNFLLHTQDQLAVCRKNFDLVKANSSSWKTYLPWIHFYGNNQYHRWLFGDGNMFTASGWKNCRGIIRGDFGVSYVTWKPVTETIARALPWSLLFTLVSVFFAYLVSIPIGVQAAAKRGSFFDRGSSVVLFMLYSLPSFLMGTLLLMTFANPDMINAFPSNGVKPVIGYPEHSGLWEKFLVSWPYMVLPLICYTYSSLAFLSRTMRVAVLEISTQDYMRTARAKGLSYYLVIYKHGLRNALLPIITVFANVFPMAVGGSVILESLFGIPGIGREILSSVITKDYQMIVAVFTLSGFMTLVGYLVADLLYAIADPRISFGKR